MGKLVDDSALEVILQAQKNREATEQDVANLTTDGSINVGSEAVSIVVTSDVQGAAISGLVINAYYNNASSPSETVATDSNGFAQLLVPNGYKYRLSFPTQQGCREIADVIHTASVNQRSVEVKYVEQSQAEGEAVTVTLQQKSGEGYTKINEGTINVTVDGVTTPYTSNAQGKITFTIPYGKQYTITAGQRENWYIPQNGYAISLTASQSARAVVYTYHNVNTGLFIVDGDGNEYTLPQFEAAVAEGTVQNSDAKLIAVKTTTLINNGGTFAVDIDHLRNRDYGSNCQWNGNNAQFNSIPLNGNSTSANYYYDGLTASRLIQAEGDERGLGTPAVDRALGMSRVLAEGTADERTLPGFLGSVGQWAQIWANASEIDDIIQSVRPNGTYLFSTLTTQKWTSTQFSANYAWDWGSSAGNYYKDYSYVVLPFFAY